MFRISKKKEIQNLHIEIFQLKSIIHHLQQDINDIKEDCAFFKYEFQKLREQMNMK